MYKLLLVTLESCTCWFSSSQRASAKSLARMQNAVVPTYSNDIILLSLTPTLQLLSSSADSDDITADVIIADSRSCASFQLLIVMTSSLLLIAFS
ncbi:hypothetical protein F511_36530 [Dorcoceras hygrometricum]|uniref:Uncharacterized protein n=1 Tax=Dorcoceras hygrometricum TaxID=472368 RepID=A0A2Z7CLR2_9LAMI|nr:hypothetical protein F511_36530 [Dorcoceras hygrometricum]